ncbi:hypothetical protein [Streptomyces sp. NPDC048606]|uniref:hypothetical protein n=1 Tax=Streptomyces sp. NPDC048606 TaxID=3154726 RepID=UPI003435A589
MPRRPPGRIRREPRSGAAKKTEPYVPTRTPPDALLPAETHERWAPLAVLLHGHLPGLRTTTSYVNCTRLLRTSPFGLWVRLRELLVERGLTIPTTVLVSLFPDGACSETGVVHTDGGRVYAFDLAYDRLKDGDDRNAVITRWRDVTHSWEEVPFHSEIEDAFLWRPPARRTSFALPEAAPAPPEPLGPGR